MKHPLMALAGLCAVYLALAVPSSLMIPASEANDEAEHVFYAQRVPSYASGALHRRGERT